MELRDGEHSVEFLGAEVRFTNLKADRRASAEPAVVFVHGWSSSRAFWDAQMDGLRGARRLIAIDLPGYGESEDVEEEHSFHLYADAIDAVLRSAGVDNAVLVGHSNGVPTVRQYYRRHPERTAGLVAVDGALRNRFDDGEELRSWIEGVSGPGYLEWAAAFLERVSEGMADRQERERLCAIALATPQRVMLGGFQAIADPTVWVEDKIDAPLLVINAAAPYWTEDYVQYVRDLGPDVAYVEWDDVSHCLQVDQPERFNRTLLDWLERRGF